MIEKIYVYVLIHVAVSASLALFLAISACNTYCTCFYYSIQGALPTAWSAHTSTGWQSLALQVEDVWTSCLPH